MSTWRHRDKVYQALVERFDQAVDDIWPEWGQGECNLLSSKTEHLEELMLSSYTLMKYIREWLTSQDLPFQQGWKYPNLYSALECAVDWMQRASGSLATEADRLEQVSRASYHWMKTYRKLGQHPTRKQLENDKANTGTIKREPQPTWDEWQKNKYGRARVFCMCCKTKLATDDANMLCAYCSGMNGEDKATILGMPDVNLTGKCSQCRMPCKAGKFYCDLCSVGQREPGKPTTLFIGNERRVERPPFDDIDRSFPLDSIGGYGDMIMPTRRKTT